MGSHRTLQAQSGGIRRTVWEVRANTKHPFFGCEPPGKAEEGIEQFIDLQASGQFRSSFGAYS